MTGAQFIQKRTSLSGLRILVVEDELIIAWDIAEILAEHGCEVVGPAYDLAQAEALSRQRPLDGAVLDVNLGRDRVFPLADALADERVPFCFVTAYGDAAVRPADAGRPVLQKPIDLERLVRTLEGWRPTEARAAA